MIQRNTSTNWKRVVKITEAEHKKKKNNFWKENSLRGLWDNINHINICIIRVPEGGEREKCRELIWEIIAENFFNLGKETDIQVWEAWRVSSKMTPKIFTPRHTAIKMAKLKDRLLKAEREK